MAITTLDGLIAGLRPPVQIIKAGFTGEASGQIHDLGGIAGQPGARVLAAPGAAGATVDNTSSIAGMLPWTNPASGNAYLARLAFTLGANMIGLMLYDMLWYQSGLTETTTTAQTINSVAWPSRSADGTANGEAVEIWMHCTTATTNSAAITNTAYSYTNQDGTAGRSAGLAYSWPATTVAGTMVPFGFQAGDTGVRSVQTVTLGTSYVAGQVELFALRRIATLWLPAGVTGLIADPFAVGMPQLFNGSALYGGVFLSATTTGVTAGEVNFAHG